MTDKTISEPEFAESAAPSIDLTAIIADFRRFSRFFTAVLVIAFMLFIVPLFLQTPKYTASSSVMMDPRTMNVSGSEDVLSGLPADTTTIDTEAEVLKSNALAERVMVSLKLDADPEFNSALAKPNPISLAGLKDLVTGGKKEVDQTPLAQQKAREAILSNVVRGLSVRRQGMTRIINISYTTRSPQKSAKIANEWARLYLSQQLETKFQATKEANDWLNSRLTDLKVQVETAETAVQQYKIANNILDSTGNNTLAQTQISTLDQQLAGVKVDQAESDARLAVARRQLASGSSGDDVGATMESAVINNLKAQRATVSQNLADLQSRYGQLHPDVVKSKKQLEDIDNQIAAETRRILSNLEAQAQVQRQRTASLQSSVYQARGQLVGNNRAMVKLNELQRSADAVSTLYQSYLDRFKQTSAQQGIDRTDARIVSSATLPGKPSSPKTALFLAIALVGAFGVACLSVLLRRALDSGLTTAQDVETHLSQAHLSNLADLASTVDRPTNTSPIDFVVEKPLSVFAEGFRNLRAALIYSRIGEQVKVIAMTSALPGEGKTTASIALARTMSMSGQSVVVVDCDLRRRSVNRVLGKTAEAGLIEVLGGTAKLADVLITDDLTGVRFLPIANGSHTPRDLFGSEVMDRLLDTLREQFDVVILDTAPVLPIADTRILARKADVVAMLVHWRKTPRKAVQAAIGILEDAEAHVVGVVLTQVNIKEQARFGYGDTGYYYNEYKKYYTS